MNLKHELTKRLVFDHPRLMRALIRMTTPGGEADVNVCGVPLRIDRREERSLWRSHRLLEDTYTGRVMGSVATLALIVGPGDTFVDVGANVGLFASGVSRLSYLFPAMRCYAIEPHPAAARRLRESVKGRNVEILEIAVSDRSGTLEFSEGISTLTFSPKDGATSFTLPGATTVVEARRLDELDLQGDSLVVKLSVRGFERQVLDGATGLMEARRVKALFVYREPDDHDLPDRLMAQGFALFDSTTLKPGVSQNVLAVQRRWLEFLTPVCSTAVEPR
jgi:FkbM family methyltransferase